MNNTTTKTRCETVDMTVPWTDEQGRLNVVKGDLIEDGRVVRYELDGRLGVEFAAPKDLVKVFRYIETTEK